MYTRKEVYTRKEPVQPIPQSAVHSFVQPLVQPFVQPLAQPLVQPLVQPPVFKVIIFILKELSSVDVIASDSQFSKLNLHCKVLNNCFFLGALLTFV